jgi:ribosomal-protein-alanine N-acetyltransferase
MQSLETLRLVLRPLDGNDAKFIVELLNDPAFIRYIGDRGVRTMEQALGYLTTGPIRSYEQFGFGLLCVQSKLGVRMGVCGLVQRDYFPDPDIGFAFLPQFRSQGYAREASEAVLSDAQWRLKLKRIVAIVQPDNSASLTLLRRLNFSIERKFRLSVNDPELLVLALENRFD